MDAPVEIDQPILQSFPIFFPRHSVYSRRRLLLQALVAAAEQIDVHGVQQCREP